MNDNNTYLKVAGVTFFISLLLFLVVLAMAKPTGIVGGDKEPTYTVTVRVPIDYDVVSRTGFFKWEIKDITSIEIREEKTRFSSVPLFFSLGPKDVVVKGYLDGKKATDELGSFSALGETKTATLTFSGVSRGTHTLKVEVYVEGEKKTERLFEVEVK